MKDSLYIAIAGATGYIGIQLIKILSKHPKVKILYLCGSKSVGKSILSFDKEIKKKNLPKISKVQNVNWKKIDILFTALPNGEAQKISNNLLTKNLLFDLSADFRLSNQYEYLKWYKRKHLAIKNIKKSIYALPEIKKKYIKKYKIISCPGCYPTSILLPLIPLLKKNIINQNNIIID